ncbi:hypothetical protein OAK75_00835 [Bacteriovoracales bacterium]|nr:hypothetical protein [Bacteriovoracales bacterium]
MQNVIKNIKLIFFMTALGLCICTNRSYANQSYCEELTLMSSDESISYQPQTIQTIAGYCKEPEAFNRLTTSLQEGSSYNYGLYGGDDYLDKVENLTRRLKEIETEKSWALKHNEFNKEVAGHLVGESTEALASLALKRVPGLGETLGDLTGGIAEASYKIYLHPDNADDIIAHAREKKLEVAESIIGGIVNDLVRDDVIAGLKSCQKETDNTINCPELTTEIWNQLVAEMTMDMDPESQEIVRDIVGREINNSALRVMAEALVSQSEEIKEDMNHRFTEISTQVTGNQEASELNREKLKEHSQKLKTINHALHRQDQAMKSLLDDFKTFREEVQQQFDKVGAHLQTMDGRITTNAKHISENRKLINKNRQDINSLSNDVGFMTEWMFSKMSPEERLSALEADLFPCRQTGSAKEECELNRTKLVNKTKTQIKQQNLLKKFEKTQEVLAGALEINQLIANLGLLPQSVVQGIGKGIQVASALLSGIMANVVPPGNPMAIFSSINSIFSIFGGGPNPPLIIQKLDQLLEGQQRILDGLDIVISNQAKLFEGQRKIFKSIVDLRKELKDGLHDLNDKLYEQNQNILFNRKILTSSFDREIENCDSFLKRPDSKLVFNTTTSYSGLLTWAGAESYFKDCADDLHNFATSDSQRGIRINAQSWEDASVNDTNGGLNSYHELQNHVILPQFNVLIELLKNSELPFFDSKRTFCPNNERESFEEFKFKCQDPDAKHQDNRPTINEIMEDLTFNSEEERQDKLNALIEECYLRFQNTCLSFSTYLDLPEKEDRLWVILKRSSEDLKLVDKKVNIKIERDFTPPDLDIKVSDECDNKSCKFREKIKTPINHNFLFRWIDTLFNMEPWLDLKDNRADSQNWGQLIPIDKISKNPPRENARDFAHYLENMLIEINTAIAHENFLAGDILIPHLYEELKKTDWLRKYSLIKRGIKIASSPINEDSPHLSKLCSLMSDINDDGKINTDDHPGNRGLEKSNIAHVINGACLLKTNPLLAGNFVKYLILKELEESNQSLISYQLATIHKDNDGNFFEPSSDLLQGVTKNKWDFYYSNGNDPGAPIPGWYIKFGDEIKIKLPLAKNLKRPVFQLGSHYPELIKYKEKIIKAISRRHLIKKISEKGSLRSFSESERSLIITGMIVKGASKGKQKYKNKNMIIDCYSTETQKEEQGIGLGLCSLSKSDPAKDCLLKEGDECKVFDCRTWNTEALLDNPKCLNFTGAEQYIRECYNTEGHCIAVETDPCTNEPKCLIQGSPNDDGSSNCEVFQCKEWNYDLINTDGYELSHCSTLAWSKSLLDSAIVTTTQECQ